MEIELKYLLVELRKDTSFNDAKRVKERLELWVDVDSVIPFENKEKIIEYFKEK